MKMSVILRETDGQDPYGLLTNIWELKWERCIGAIRRVPYMCVCLYVARHCECIIGSTEKVYT